MVRHAFRAMGTSVEVLLDVEPSLDTVLGIASTERLFWRLEDSMSRFDPVSELSRLNAQGWLDVSDDFAAVVELGLDARARTGGRFDPTVHEALMAAEPDPSATVPVCAAVLQPGYRLKAGRVLRPARVSVAEPAPGQERAADPDADVAATTTSE